ncbi:MAG: hypothetical protein K9K93_08260 [Acholeplasmataceae bacterium]|nr:hypothetical protein [Acholeplasmataceae bacterium]
MEKNVRLKKSLYIVSLASVASVLGIFEIPMLVPWLKIDLSEVVVLVSAIVVGYKGAFGVIGLRSLVRRLALGFLPSEIIGELIAVVASLVILGAYYLASKLAKTHRAPLMYEIPIEKPKVTLKETLITTGIITFSLAFVLLMFNFFIATPLYLSVLGRFELPFADIKTIHFTVFTFLKDPAIMDLLIAFDVNLDEPYLSSFFLYIMVMYAPLNISKGITTTLVFLLIKPRLQYLEL